jgi:hypothetical protein
MKNSVEKSIDRANAMINIIAKVVHEATGVSPDELRSDSCSHRVTKARFIFVDLCNGVVSPMPLIADYLGKNNSMISYYKRSHNDYYDIYRDFRGMSDKADKLLTELLTTINGTFENVFQEEGEQVQC